MSGLLALQTAVAAVLLFSAALKMASRTSPRALLASMALPPWVQSAAALVAPAEVLIAVALIAGAGAWAGIAAAGLSLAFVTTMTVALRRGVREACKCFGALDSAELTPLAVLRAAVLAAGSVVLATWQFTSSPIAAGSAVDGATQGAMLVGLTGAVTYVVTFALADRVIAFERYRKDFNVALTHFRRTEGAR